MTFTCDRCHEQYEARAGTAVAFLFVKDSRCNHLEARCSRCGAVEVIFLGPNRLEESIRAGRLDITVKAEASSALRVRAECAWAAAEDVPEESRGALDHREVRHHPLTPRHETLIASFGETLGNIPDDLLWDAFGSDHGREHPERWTD